MLKSHGLQNVILGGCVLYFTSAIHAAPKLHRAVEPAQVMLDATVTKNHLTLFLTIPANSLKSLSSGVSPQAIANILSQSPMHWQTSGNAKCSLKNHRVFLNNQPVSNNSNGDIQAIYEFECSAPEYLLSIQPQLLTFLPGLKQINAWVTTDSWQNKQAVDIPMGVIHLKPAS